jgi:hypothetical protein
MKLHRRIPCEPNLAAEPARIGGKKKLLAGNDPGQARVVILKGGSRNRRRRGTAGLRLVWLERRFHGSL